MHGPFIVKVQLSLYPPGGREVLVYNEDRSFMGQMETSEEVREVMRGRPKMFFWATVTGLGELTLGDEAPDQMW